MECRIYSGQLRFLENHITPIAKGEHIYAWSGPQYKCDPQHPVELMAKAVITYGVDIEKSTGAPGLQGAWRKLPAVILYKLREILLQRGYTAPAQPTPNHANQPSGQPKRPIGDELHVAYTPVPEETKQTQRHTRARHTLDLTGDRESQGIPEKERRKATKTDTIEKNTKCHDAQHKHNTHLPPRRTI